MQNVIATATGITLMGGRKVNLLSLLNLARQRRALSKLDQRLLADIGIDAAAATSESQRPIWDVPSVWRG